MAYTAAHDGTPMGDLPFQQPYAHVHPLSEIHFHIIHIRHVDERSLDASSEPLGLMRQTGCAVWLPAEAHTHFRF